MYIRACILLIFILGIASLPVLHTSAQTNAEPFNLTASPLPVNLVTTPGKPISTPIQIENTGTQTVRIKVSLLKFSVLSSEGKPKILDPTPQDTFIKWVHFSEDAFDAPPNVYHKINMTINPPASAAFGYYYAVVFSVDKSKTPVPTGSRQNKVNGALATLVLLDVRAPGEKVALKVTNFSSEKKVYQYLPADFNITVQNTGNIHAIPTGNIYISRNGKDTIDILDVNKEQGNVLPDSSRTFTASWDNGFPAYVTKRVNGQVLSDKNSKPIQQLSWDTSKLSRFRFGHYTAHLTLAYSDGKRDVPLDAETSFWVIPWQLILIVLVILVVIGFGLFVIARSFFRQTQRQTKKLQHKKNVPPPRS